MWTYIYSDELYHHGIKGQKWGVRRYQNKDGSLTPAGKKRAKTELTPEQKAARKDKIKKVAAGTAAVVTVAAAAGLYAKNKPAVDKFVKEYLNNAKVAKAAKQEAYAKSHKDSILKSASKLNKYKQYYDDQTVSKAVKNLQTTRDLHNLSQDRIRRGANYAQAFIAYGTAATAIYGFAKSPMVKDAKKSKAKKKRVE